VASDDLYVVTLAIYSPTGTGGGWAAVLRRGTQTADRGGHSCRLPAVEMEAVARALISSSLTGRTHRFCAAGSVDYDRALRLARGHAETPGCDWLIRPEPMPKAG
jgi:hypothetical protein